MSLAPTIIWLTLSVWGQNAPPAISAIKWWQQDYFQENLDLDQTAMVKFTAQMDKNIIQFQLLNTKVRATRQQLVAMYGNLEINAQDVEAFYQNHVRPAMIAQRDFRVAVRLYVRKILPPEAMDWFGKKHPRFFAQNWFPSSKIAVVEGRIK